MKSVIFKSPAPDFKEEKPTLVLGKRYSFVGTDRPVMCALIGDPIEPRDYNFTLDYDAQETSGYQFVSILMNCETEHLSLTLNKTSNPDKIFTALQIKAQELGLIIELKPDQNDKICYYRGKVDKLYQLFPIIKEQLRMEDHYCMYGQGLTLTRLAELLDSLYRQITNNFAAKEAPRSGLG